MKRNDVRSKDQRVMQQADINNSEKLPPTPEKRKAARSSEASTSPAKNVSSFNDLTFPRKRGSGRPKSTDDILRTYKRRGQCSLSPPPPRIFLAYLEMHLSK